MVCSLCNYVQMHSLLEEHTPLPVWCMHSSSKPFFVFKLEKNFLVGKIIYIDTVRQSTHREKSRPLLLRNMLHRRQQ